VINMPSSTTNSSLTPRCCNSAAICLAPRPPPTSSSAPKIRRIVRCGLNPLASSASTASSSAIRLALSSHAPRPQTKPSFTVPEKGSACQSPSVPGAIGTTSWWAISAIGAACASLPSQV
jgi:hypothetical protein